MLRFGLIGFGAINRLLLEEVRAGKVGELELVGLLLRPGREVEGLPVVHSAAELLARRPDVVLEAASTEAVVSYGPEILRSGTELAIASAAALSDREVSLELQRFAREAGSRLVVPAGAIGAIDALAAMRLAGLRSVLYRGVKPPSAWRGSRAEELCDLAKLELREQFFHGTAREAAASFPKNANVAAIVGLAGLGLDETCVELVADPGAKANRHEIEAEGEAGRFRFCVEARASESNPRTSLMTVYSLLRYLSNREAALMV